MSALLRLLVLLAPLSGLSPAYGATRSLESICAGKTWPSFRESAEGAACDLRVRFGGNDRILEETGALLSALRSGTRVLPSAQAQGPADELTKSAQRLAETLNRMNVERFLRSGPAVTGGENAELKRSIRDLLKKFSSPQARRKSPERYRAALDSVLLRTKSGKEALQCFLDPPLDPKIDSKVVYVEQTPSSSRAMMMFDLVAIPSRPGHFQRTVRMNYDLDPVAALSVYAHELKHGCNASELKRCTERVQLAEQEFSGLLREKSEIVSRSQDPPRDLEQKLDRAMERSAEARIDADQTRLADEVRAYGLQLEIFKELAESEPDLFCRSVLSTGRDLSPLISESEGQILHERLMREGALALHLALYYSSAGFYELRSVVKTADDLKWRFENGNVPLEEMMRESRLRPELELRLKNERK